MKRHLALTLSCLLAAGAVMADETLQTRIDEGKGVIKAFAGDLKGELKKGMKESGPLISDYIQELGDTLLKKSSAAGQNFTPGRIR
ncbi:MAG: hypothetical protein P8178_09175 [Candidatus Thiodiazotropha sp.]